MEHTRKINLEYLAQNQPDVLAEVHRILREDGISEQSYAKVFCLCFNQIAAPEEKVSFITNGSSWQMGSRHMSDAKILVSLCQICELMHDHVLAEWNNSLFAAWIDSSALERIETAMDGMESLNKLKAILQAAGKLMAADGSYQAPPAPASAPARAQEQPPAQQSSGKKGAPMINWEKKG